MWDIVWDKATLRFWDWRVADLRLPDRAIVLSAPNITMANVTLSNIVFDRIALVGVGGCLGAVLRYLLSGYVQGMLQDIQFPYGTLVVNLMGCFVIGLLSQLADARGVFTTESRLFVFTGILGGFTTFSTFANESMNLLRDGQAVGSFANVSAQVLFGLAAVWLGRVTAAAIWR
jgi:CrcB protein